MPQTEDSFFDKVEDTLNTVGEYVQENPGIGILVGIGIVALLVLSKGLVALAL